MMFVSLYTSRVVLEVLGIDDYGIYNVVGGIVAMFSFLSGTMSFTTQRFLTFSLGTGDEERTHKVFCTSINIHIIISIFFFLFAETIGLWFLNTCTSIPPDRMYASNWIYQTSIISAIILFISMPYNGVIIAHEKMSTFAYISIFEATLRLALVVLLKYIIIDKLILYAILMLVVQLIIRIIYGVYCKHNFNECRYQYILDRPIFNAMLKFAGWSFYGGLASVGVSHGLNILLNVFFTPTINAAYAIAQQIYSAVLNFINSFLTAVRPQITKTCATQDHVRMSNIVLTSTKYSYYLTFILVVPLIFEIDPILSIWLKEVPDYTACFVRWILCISLIEVLANPIITATNATGNIAKYQKIIGSMQLLVLPISYISLKYISSPDVVFICQFIFTIIIHIVRLWVVSPIVNIPIRRYIKNVIWPVVLVTLISCIIPIIAHTRFDSYTLKGFMLLYGINIISILITVWIVGINKSEKQFILNQSFAFINKIGLLSRSRKYNK